MSTDQERIFKRKNDVYYVSLLVYVVFAVVYILITGTVTSERIVFGFKDPVVYVIGLFIVHSLAMLIINIVRNQVLVLTPQRIIIRSRFHERSVYLDHIRKIEVRREQRKFNDGTFAVVRLHLEGTRRKLRLRMANFEREKELYDAFRTMRQKIASTKSGGRP